MPRVAFRFYAELNDHLPPERRQVDFFHVVPEGSTLGEALESLGVPAEEIELLLVDGESAGIAHRVQEGERVSVYPVFDAIDVAPLTKIETRPPRRLKFALDVHLGKLAHHLRMLGFDAAYRNNFSRDELVGIATGEDRILLSKSSSLVNESGIEAGYRVKSSDSREQLIEILHRFDLWRSVHPFQRCLHCNAVLQIVKKEDVADRLPQKIRPLFAEFTLCPSCQRLYWKGTHVARMIKFAGEVFAECGRSFPGVTAAGH